MARAVRKWTSRCISFCPSRAEACHFRWLHGSWKKSHTFEADRELMEEAFDNDGRPSTLSPLRRYFRLKSLTLFAAQVLRLCFTATRRPCRKRLNQPSSPAAADSRRTSLLRQMRLARLDPAPSTQPVHPLNTQPSVSSEDGKRGGTARPHEPCAGGECRSLCPPPSPATRPPPPPVRPVITVEVGKGRKGGQGEDADADGDGGGVGGEGVGDEAVHGVREPRHRPAAPQLLAHA